MWGEISAKQNQMWVLSEPNREECTVLFLCVCVLCFFARVCVVRRGVEGSRSSLLWWVYAKSGWVVRSHTPRQAEALSIQSGSGAGVVVVRVMWVCARVCVWGGAWGWDRSVSRGRYCVARLAVRTQKSSIILWPLVPPPPRPPPPASQPVRLGRAWK